MASNSSIVDAVTVTSTSKTGLLSLPDEILARIVKEVAGNFSLRWQTYQRQPDNNLCLRRLRLVSKRISRIVEQELYRAPNTMTKRQSPLTCDDIDILFHPMVLQSMQMLSLAGSAGFFAGLLALSNRNLTILSLLFSVVHVSTELHRVEVTDVMERKPLRRLRDAVRALPLRELHLYFDNDLPQWASASQYFEALQIAAGHPTLRHLNLRGKFWHTSEDKPIKPTNFVSPVAVLSVQSFSLVDSRIVRAALGNLPELSEIVLGEMRENLEATLDALTTGIADRIRKIEVIDNTCPPPTWQAFAAFTNLETLAFRQISACTDANLSSIQLSNLKTLRFTSTGTKPFGIHAAIFRWAAKRDMLPNLTTVYSNFKSYKRINREISAARNSLAAYDELRSLRPNVEIQPRGLGPWLLKALGK